MKITFEPNEIGSIIKEYVVKNLLNNIDDKEISVSDKYGGYEVAVVDKIGEEELKDE